MFKKLFLEGVTFGQDTSGSQEYWDAMSNYERKTMENLLAIKKKFRGTGEPEIFQPSGVANDGYKMRLYTSKDKKHGIDIEYYSPRSGWSIKVCWKISGTHCYTSDSIDLKELSVQSVETGLQQLANKFPAWEIDTSKWGRAPYFPNKWPAAFQKRIPKD